MPYRIRSSLILKGEGSVGKQGKGFAEALRSEADSIGESA
jgi:hypothetical protein